MSYVDELRRIAQTYQSDYEIAKAREDSIMKSLADIVSVSQTTNQAQIALRELESTAQTYRALHDNFLQRLDGVDPTAVISHHRGPAHHESLATSEKKHPKTLLILAITRRLAPSSDWA